MFFSKSNRDSEIEQRIEQQSSKIKQIEIQMENLDRDIDIFLKSINVTAEQLTAFIESKDNFTEQNWTELSHHKKLLDDKLNRELENVRNPKKTKNAYSNLHIERHWLPVR